MGDLFPKVERYLKQGDTNSVESPWNNIWNFTLCQKTLKNAGHNYYTKSGSVRPVSKCLDFSSNSKVFIQTLKRFSTCNCSEHASFEEVAWSETVFCTKCIAKAMSEGAKRGEPKMLWAFFFGWVEFLGSELTGEGPQIAWTLFFRVFSLSFRTDRKRRPTPVGESRYEFACICLNFLRIYFEKKVPFRYLFWTHLGLWETWRISNKQAETARLLLVALKSLRVAHYWLLVETFFLTLSQLRVVARLSRSHLLVPWPVPWPMLASVECCEDPGCFTCASHWQEYCYSYLSWLQRMEPNSHCDGQVCRCELVLEQILLYQLNDDKSLGGQSTKRKRIWKSSLKCQRTWILVGKTVSRMLRNPLRLN